MTGLSTKLKVDASEQGTPAWVLVVGREGADVFKAMRCGFEQVHAVCWDSGTYF